MPANVQSYSFSALFTVGHNDQMAKIIYRASSKPKIEIAPTTNRRTVVYNFS